MFIAQPSSPGSVPNSDFMPQKNQRRDPERGNAPPPAILLEKFTVEGGGERPGSPGFDAYELEGLVGKEHKWPAARSDSGIKGPADNNQISKSTRWRGEAPNAKFSHCRNNNSNNNNNDKLKP